MNNEQSADRIAVEHGFLILVPGEVYCRQVDRKGTVFIWQDEKNRFTAWAGRWNQGERVPYREKTIRSHVDIASAFAAAKQYADFLIKSRDQWMQKNHKKYEFP